MRLSTAVGGLRWAVRSRSVAHLEQLCMRNLIENNEERVFFKDLESRFVLVSEGFVQALGGGRLLEELVGLTDFDLFSSPHATQAFADEQRVIATGEAMPAKIERETFGDLPDRWVSTVKLPLRDEEARIVGTWGISRDVTAQVEAERALAHQALHDGLTGLPNRVLVVDRTEQLLARTRRVPKPVVLFFLDIDGFKYVNDTFGHAAGDELLRAVAARLSSVVRETDTVGRLGGDEFVILLDPATLSASPELVAERVLSVLRQPIDLNGSTGRLVSITASLGIATGPCASADELMHDADIALYRAKEAGKDRYMRFETGMQAVAEEHLTLELDLRDALDSDQLVLAYQPTFDLQSETVTGVEALVRWQHPSRGLLAPDTFIPLAEETGLIVPLGRWVLREACQQAAAWHRHGHTVGIAVNVSGRQLDCDEFPNHVLEALHDSGLEPAALTIEITETTLMRNADKAAEQLTALKALGIRIAIDDFGTGYSSLAYLRQFPVDALKIDRSFISGIAASKESAALIHTLIQLGKTLGLETLGEGIEDQAQLRRLQREQCDLGQGFLLARPLSLAAIEQFLETPTPTTATKP